nr:hypothetical protein [Spirochaetia bacterium]
MRYTQVKVTESINDKNIMKAVFLAGGGGSGKSFIAEHMFLTKDGISPFGVKIVNSDYFFELGLKKANLPMTIKSDGSEVYDQQMAVRSDAKAKAQVKKNYHIDSLLPIIIDGTGKDYDDIVSQAEELKNIGYDVSMVLVNTSLEVSLERNAKRARKIDPNIVTTAWTGVQSNIGKFQKYFGRENFLIIDNSTYFEPDSKESEKFLDYLFKMGKKMIEKPLKNPKGITIIKTLEDIGGKYLSDLFGEA